MFKRSFAPSTKEANKVAKAPSKASRPSKRSFTNQARMKLQQLTLDGSSPNSKSQSGPIVTLVVGPEARMFACHSDVLSASPFFTAVMRGQFYDAGTSKRIELPDEEPEIFSAILEYLYKGDYYPRLLHQENKLKRTSWTLEDAQAVNTAVDTPTKPSGSPTFYHLGLQAVFLKDTAVYCAADRYGLGELQKIALRKQGLRTGIPVDVILRSARYAYEHTPEHDAKLRAHFLALIIRSRRTFKRSGTMQMEMEAGGSKLFFDLFVAMCNHIDDITELTSKASPKTI